ncbi:MAG: hypothetical protein ACREX3_01525 [Gammaproteobacteria bacterium]
MAVDGAASAKTTPGARASLIYRDKLGRRVTFSVTPGRSVAAALSENRIPVSAVTARRAGVPLSESEFLVPGDEIHLEMNRGYDLYQVIRMPTDGLVVGEEAAVHRKSCLWFDNGSVRRRSLEMGPKAFIQLFEETLLQTLVGDEVIRQNDRIVLGLSGGRDSTAFLVARDRLRYDLPPHDLVAVTLRGLPDWDDEFSFGYTKDLCQRFGLEHVLVEPRELESIFNLNRPYAEVLDALLQTAHAQHVIWIGHHTIRHALTLAARRQGCDNVFLALNLEDCMAGLLMSLTSGYLMGGFPTRLVSDIRFGYPLWLFPKKEVNLYLELVAPEFCQQSPPSRFNLGPGVRHFMYAMADYLQDLWPGIEHHLFAAQARMFKTSGREFEWSTCRNCSADLLSQEAITDTEITGGLSLFASSGGFAVDAEGSSPRGAPDLCDVCQLFNSYGFLRQ